MLGDKSEEDKRAIRNTLGAGAKERIFGALVPRMWGLSWFAEQRNLKKICRGMRNSSDFSGEQRNSLSILDADFHENEKRNAEFYEILWICGSFISFLVKR